MKLKRPFTEEDWLATPGPVCDYIEQLESTVLELVGQVKQLTERVEKLENRLNINSQNSSQPQSSDLPYNNPPKVTFKVKNKNRKKEGKKDTKDISRYYYLRNLKSQLFPANAYAAALTGR